MFTNRLKIFLFNKDYTYSMIKNKIKDKLEIGLKGICREQNRSFDSYVRQLRNTNRTVINLTLQF